MHRDWRVANRLCHFSISHATSLPYTTKERPWARQAISGPSIYTASTGPDDTKDQKLIRFFSNPIALRHASCILKYICTVDNNVSIAFLVKCMVYCHGNKKKNKDTMKIFSFAQRLFDRLRKKTQLAFPVMNSENYN